MASEAVKEKRGLISLGNKFVFLLDTCDSSLPQFSIGVPAGTRVLRVVGVQMDTWHP